MAVSKDAATEAGESPKTDEMEKEPEDAEEISDGETRYAPDMMGPDARCRGTMEKQRRWPGRDGEWCNGTGGKGERRRRKRMVSKG